MNAIIRELARQAGMTRMKSDRYASFGDQELTQLVELVVAECAQAAESIEECRRYRDLIQRHLVRHFDFDPKF